MAKGKRKKSANMEVAGIVFIGISLLLGLGLYFESAGILGNAVRNVGLGVLGTTAYLLPPAILGLGVYVAFYMKKAPKGATVAAVGVISLALLCLFHLVFTGKNTEGGFIAFVHRAYQAGMEGSWGAGAFGAVFVCPMLILLGTAGAYVLCIVTALIVGILHYRISIRTVRETVKEHLPERKRRIDPTRLDVDDPEYLAKKRRGPKFFNIKEEEQEGSRRLSESEEDIAYLAYELDGTEEPPAEETSPWMAETVEGEDVVIPFVHPKKRHPSQLEEGVEGMAAGRKTKRKERRTTPVVGVVMEDTPSKTLPYRTPPVNMLVKPETGKGLRGVRGEVKNGSNLLERTFEDFGINARVVGATVGPSVTQYEVQPAPGVKVNRIVNLADDIALAMAAVSIRIEAPIPGKNAVGIEVPNRERTPVMLREIIESDAYRRHPSKIAIPLGKDLAGVPQVIDLAVMPHLLVAGTTGSGKSVCINCIIMGLLFRSKPEDVRLILVDPKKVEMTAYQDIPHLMIPVVTEPKKAAGALNWAVTEMVKRYSDFAEKGAKDIGRYNEIMAMTEQEKLPYLVVVVDELADLMMTAPKDVEDALCRIAQMGRAAGIHLIVATQRPSVDVITGRIKGNFPSRIAFTVSSQVDSRTILDMAGAEKLLGRGDMLFVTPAVSKPLRVQCAFISDPEVEAVTNFVKESSHQPEYDEAVLEEIDKNVQSVGLKGERGNNGTSGVSIEEEGDALLKDAALVFLDAGQASTSMLQRRFRVGYARAARIVDELEQAGVVGPPDGSKPRAVLMGRPQIEEIFGKEGNSLLS